MKIIEKVDHRENIANDISVKVETNSKIFVKNDSLPLRNGEHAMETNMINGYMPEYMIIPLEIRDSNDRCFKFGFQVDTSGKNEKTDFDVMERFLLKGITEDSSNAKIATP